VKSILRHVCDILPFKIHL